ncbi:pectinesterase [Mycena floridula]|nr:pectinesterase [Mycena floridula]
MAFRRLALLVCFYSIFVGILSVQGSPLEKRASRTTPPAGAVIVRPTPASGEFKTIQSAVNSLDATSTKTIFIFPGTYSEQVSITRTGKLTIMGSTTDTTTWTANSVTLTHSLSATAAGDDDDSGTLRVHKDNFALYNINVRNTFGQGSQALALSAYGNNQGYYGVAFFGYQDTVLSEIGNQFFGFCYIEGAVDYIFGQHARTFFHKNTIASVGPGAITADGPASTDNSSFSTKLRLITSSAATSSLTGQVFLGRPWTQFAHVAFISSSLGSLINSAGWEIWSTATPNTADVTFAEFANTGTGAAGTRASFATKLTSTSGYTIDAVLGSTWASWVDTAYAP